MTTEDEQEVTFRRINSMQVARHYLSFINNAKNLHRLMHHGDHYGYSQEIDEAIDGFMEHMVRDHIGRFGVKPAWHKEAQDGDVRINTSDGEG